MWSRISSWYSSAVTLDSPSASLQCCCLAMAGAVSRLRPATTCVSSGITKKLSHRPFQRLVGSNFEIVGRGMSARQILPRPVGVRKSVGRRCERRSDWCSCLIMGDNPALDGGLGDVPVAGAPGACWRRVVSANQKFACRMHNQATKSAATSTRPSRRCVLCTRQCPAWG
jgi:hypothetical protein